MLLFAALMGVIAFSSCSEKDEEEKKETGTETLRVTPGSLLFDAVGGTKSLTIKSNYEYFGVDITANWLDYDYDEDRDQLLIIAEANNTDKVRQANVIIMGSDDGETIKERVTIKVEQEAGKNSKTNATATISSSGGTVDVGGLQLQFPSGTYVAGGEVKAEIVAKGSVIDGDEVSDCYQLTYDADTRKTITVQIAGEKGNDVRLAVKHRGWVYSSKEMREVDMTSMLPTTYANGIYSAEIPAFHLKEGLDALDVSPEFDKSSLPIESDAKMTIALVETGDASPARPTDTRSSARRMQYDLKWVPKRDKNYDIDEELKEEVIPDMLDRFANDMSFELPSGDYLPIRIEEDKSDPGWGYFYTSGLCSAFDYILINKIHFNGTLSDSLKRELRATMIHECQHYVQSHSYPGFTFNFVRKYSDGYGNVKWLIMDEASSVWSETYYTETPEHTLLFGPKAVRNFFPDDVFCSYHYSKKETNTGEKVEGEAHSRCEEMGYGLSIYVKYIANRWGDDAPVKMFKARRDGTKTLRECFEAIDGDIAKYETILDFIFEAGTGRLFSKISFETLTTGLGNNYANKTGKMQYKEKMPAVSAYVDKYFIHSEYKGNLSAEQVKITQNSPDVMTTVWLVANKDWRNAKELGRTSNGEPFIYDGDLKKLKSTKKSGDKEDNNPSTLYLVSIPYYDRDCTCDITVEQDRPILEVNPKKLSFEADGGSQEITVRHNQAKLAYSISDKTWIHWESVSGQAEKRKVTVDPNTSQNERTGTIILGAKNAKGDVVIRDTINITQKGKQLYYPGKFYGSYWYSKKDQESGKKAVLVLNAPSLYSPAYFYSSLGGGEGSFEVLTYENGSGTIKEPNGNVVSFSYTSKYVEFGGGVMHYMTYNGIDLVRWDQVDM